MAKLPRVFQRIFGSSAGTNQLAQFGSLAAGTPEFSTNLSTIMSLSNWLTGWFGAVVGANSPAIEDMNSFCFVVTSQLAEIYQDGVPPYEANTTYFYGSLASNGQGLLFVCINDNSGAGISNEPLSNSTYWAVFGGNVTNSIINGAFDYFQRGTSITAAYNMTRSFTYIADRWATWCGAGTSAVTTGSQQAPTLAGSAHALKVAASTAPSSASAVGVTLYHVLDTLDSVPYYNGFGSFGAYIKATGNVTQVQLQFLQYSANSGVAAGYSLIGSPVDVTVSTSGFTLAEILGQAMGTAQGTTGVVGILINANAVSTGHLSDVGNGFIIEQATMVPGAILPPFHRAHSCAVSELAAAQAYYEKSFTVNTTPGDNLSVEGSAVFWAQSSSLASAQIFFKTTKRQYITGLVSPAITFYNPDASSANKIWDNTSSTSIPAQVVLYSTNNFQVSNSGGTFAANDEMLVQWAADAEIY